jgi:hypothetical protein
MTLPTSGNITLAQVRAEFGGAAGTALHSYNRGGSRVPNTTKNAGIPTAAPITLHQFYGASAFSASVSPSSVSGSRATIGTATTGACTCTPVGATSPTYTWTFVSGDSGVVPTAGTSATTAFSASVSAGNDARSAVYKCVVHDSAGGTVDSDTVTASLSFTG